MDMEIYHSLKTFTIAHTHIPDFVICDNGKNIGNILLSEINQTHEKKYHMILKTESKISLVYRTKSRMDSSCSEGLAGSERCWAKNKFKKSKVQHGE